MNVTHTIIHSNMIESNDTKVFHNVYPMKEKGNMNILIGRLLFNIFLRDSFTAAKNCQVYL